jgi:hypothetical protein
VFPARYELNSYIVFRKRLVSKRLTVFARSNTEIVASNTTHVWVYVSVVLCGGRSLATG